MGFEREAVQKPCPETESLSSIQIVDVLKLFRGNVLIILLLQHLIGVREHIVDVLDKDPFVSRH